MATPYKTKTHGDGRRMSGRKKWKLVVSLAAAGVAATPIIHYQNTDESTTDVDSYQENLQMIKAHTGRNTLQDSSAYIDTPMDELVATNHYGANDRSDYTATHSGGDNNAELHFPIAAGGQFRTVCEFSHFAYDDPILYPDQPGKAHLHMFFGNTDVNAFTTQETLEDSGSGTCNGQELNRSGYWVPAMFDGSGNLRIPERIVVYYKGEGMANGGPNGLYANYPGYGSCGGCANPGSQRYPRGARAIAPNPVTLPEMTVANGGASNQVNYKCTSNNSGAEISTGIANIPNCDGDYYINTFGAPYPATRTVLEMEVKFLNCFPAYDENNPLAGSNPDITDHNLWQGSANGGWFWSDCDGEAGGVTNGDFEIYPNFSYFVNYVVEPGDDTSDWFLSSDVDTATLGNATPSLLAGGAGGAHHGDAWWAWHPDTLQTALDNCINFTNTPTASGCGSGFLSDGGPTRGSPLAGDSLKLRDDYDTVGSASSYYISAATIFADLCSNDLAPTHTYSHVRHAAYCQP